MKTIIYTEIYNCGLIGKKCLESFFKYHPDTIVHVAGTHKDFKELGKFKNIEYIDFSGDDVLLNMYKNQGHLGTAYIFTKVLKGEYGDYNQIIHFDSDTIFRSECLSYILNKFDEGFDLIGPRRLYKKNVANKNGEYDSISDVVGTYFFGYNNQKVSPFDFDTIHRMVVGYYNPIGFPCIDFFDPISFDILKNGGKIYHLDYEKFGSPNEDASFLNKYGELNKIMDFGDNIIHFAGVGSGMNFYKNGQGSVPATYVDWAKGRFALYMKLFYNKDVEIEYDKNDYEKIKSQIMKDIRVFCPFAFDFQFTHEKQIELFVDMNGFDNRSEDAVKILLIIESSAIIPNVIEKAIENHQSFDYILTFDETVLEKCNNAHLFEYGTTWIKTPYIYPEKKFQVSTIVGGKKITSAHVMRQELWEKQGQIEIPKSFFVSGNYSGDVLNLEDTKTLGDEKNALFDSQFHIAIENMRNKYYFTEKLIDCFKTKTIPIYYGCTGIGEYFNTEGMYIVNSLEEIINVCNSLTENTYNEKKAFVEENFEKSKRFWDYKEFLKNKIQELVK